MKTDVSINVIIPVYNTEKYIEKCLDSLVNQTFTNWNAVIVNDGSTDNSERICENYCKKYPGKFFVLNKEHDGPGRARNYGMDHAPKSAKYFYFCDSDDYLEKDGLEKLFNLAEDSKAEIAVCGYTVHTGNSKESFGYKKGTVEKEEICCSILETEDIGCYVWNKLFLCSLFDDVRFPENVLYEDVITIYKIVLKCKKIAVIPDSLYNYISRSGSIVATYDLKYLEDLIKAIKKRNDAITEQYPHLEYCSELSMLKTNIYVWNQICKGKLYSEQIECEKIINSIREEKKLYRKLDFKHMLMAHAISYCPRFYENVLYNINKIMIRFIKH